MNTWNVDIISKKIHNYSLYAQKSSNKTVEIVQKVALAKKTIDNVYENYYTAIVSKSVY